MCCNQGHGAVYFVILVNSAYVNSCQLLAFCRIHPSRTVVIWTLLTPALGEARAWAIVFLVLCIIPLYCALIFSFSIRRYVNY